jgi:hypothetical protein
MVERGGESARIGKPSANKTRGCFACGDRCVMARSVWWEFPFGHNPFEHARKNCGRIARGLALSAAIGRARAGRRR